MGFQEEEERPRPAFAAKAPFLEKNPITGVKEPSFPQSKRYLYRVTEKMDPSYQFTPFSPFSWQFLIF